MVWIMGTGLRGGGGGGRSISASSCRDVSLLTAAADKGGMRFLPAARLLVVHLGTTLLTAAWEHEHASACANALLIAALVLKDIVSVRRGTNGWVEGDSAETGVGTGKGLEHLRSSATCRSNSTQLVYPNSHRL